MVIVVGSTVVIRSTNNTIDVVVVVQQQFVKGVTLIVKVVVQVVVVVYILVITYLVICINIRSNSRYNSNSSVRTTEWSVFVFANSIKIIAAVQDIQRYMHSRIYVHINICVYILYVRGNIYIINVVYEYEKSFTPTQDIQKRAWCFSGGDVKAAAPKQKVGGVKADRH